MPALELERVSITVGDLGRAVAFYRDALGFGSDGERPIDDPAFARLLGVAETITARAVDLNIGVQSVELVQFNPAGHSYPPGGRGNDPWFQHIALVAGDITAVYERLHRHAASAISAEGPQLLPPNTGGVTAYKFRDPEGHPLELLAFPEGIGDAVWHKTADPGILGYDHSAIVVTDLERSLAFYTEHLGLSVAGRSLNQGIEQDRLDGLDGCVVDVVGLAPAEVPTPHIELLHYRAPPARAPIGAIAANDIGSTRFVFRADDLHGLVERLETAGVSFVSPGVVTFGDGRQLATIRDPDGHMIELTTSG